MSRIIIKSTVCLFFVFCVNCSAQIMNDQGVFFEFSLKEKETFTTDFYDIFVLPKADKSTFNIQENITLSIGISNNGVKDFFIPEYLSYGGVNNELYIEVYKMNELNNFVKYKSPVPRGSTIGRSKRKIFPIKNGQGYVFENITLDFINKISEPGIYKAKIFIDFSNLGYFKKLIVSTTSFKVVE